MVDLVDLADLDASPHAVVFEDAPRTVELALEAGEGVPAHSHPGTYVVLSVVSGRLEVTLDGTAYEVGAGTVMRFPGDREVTPRAIEDAVALLVFVPAATD